MFFFETRSEKLLEKLLGVRLEDFPWRIGDDGVEPTALEQH